MLECLMEGLILKYLSLYCFNFIVKLFYNFICVVGFVYYSSVTKIGI